MNLIYKIVLPMVILGTVSCSTLEADQEDSTIPALPSDFDAKVYLEINPDVLLPILKDEINRANSKQVFADPALKTQDDSTFAADSLTVMWLVDTFKRTALNQSLKVENDSLKFECLSGDCAKKYVTLVKDYNYLKQNNDMSLYQAFLKTVDSVTIAEYHYRVAGRFSGFPYKYCGADKGAVRNTTKTDPKKADFQVTVTQTPQKSNIYDFSAKTFCYDVTENDFFLNKEQN